MAPKKDLAVCDTCSMSGLAEFFTEEDICMQCRKITALEKTMMDQQKRLTELEHIVKSLSERVAAERTKSYAEIVKESAPSETRKEGIREITVKSKEPKTSPAPRRPRNTFVYVGEEAESVSVEKRVVLIGDSNVRQVGQNLAEQSNKFVTICQPGAKLEDVQEILDSTHKDGDTCVIEVGTNNLFSDEKADIIKKFQFILQELKKRRRRVVVMGILPRRLSREMERKRTSVNEELWELCQSEGAEFLNADFDVWDRYLGKDGLHLNSFDTITPSLSRIIIPIYLNATRAKLLFTVDFEMDEEGSGKDHSFYEQGVAIIANDIGS